MNLTDIHGPINAQQCNHAATSEKGEAQCKDCTPLEHCGSEFCIAHGDRSAMKPLKQDPCDCGYGSIGHLPACPGIQWDEDRGNDPNHPGNVPPTDWQARALALESELRDSKRYGAYKDETATGFMNQVKRLQSELSASQAEAGRFRDVLKNIHDMTLDSTNGLFPAKAAIIEIKKVAALSPAEKGGEG